MPPISSSGVIGLRDAANVLAFDAERKVIRREMGLAFQWSRERQRT
jgi:hypothetical protein